MDQQTLGRIRDTLKSSIPPFKLLIFDSTKTPNPTVKDIVQTDFATLSQVLREFNLGPRLVDLVTCLYDATIHQREDIVCPHRWFELKEDIQTCIPPKITVQEVNNPPETVISENIPVTLPKYNLPKLDSKITVQEVNNPPETVVSENIPVTLPKYNLPKLDLEPEPEQKIIQKSRTSLANILKNIDELLPNVKKLPPAQQKEQNTYATMIKANIVNLTEEDLTTLLRVFKEGETKEVFNQEYNEHITADIKPIGDCRPRFNDIIRDLPRAPADVKAKRDFIMQKFAIKEQKGGRRTSRKKNASHRD